MLANMKKVTTSQHSNFNDHSLPHLPSAHIYNLESFQDQTETKLIDKVKEYLESKRRENHIQ